MKSLLFIFLLISASATAQNLTGKQQSLLFLAKTGKFFVAGAWEGVRDATDHHYASVKRVLPFINDQYFNNDLSWHNKYLNGDPAQGPAFPGATGMLVSTTDFWHRANFERNKCIIVGAVIPLWTKPDIKGLALEFICYSIAYNLGKATVNELIFHK